MTRYATLLFTRRGWPVAALVVSTLLFGCSQSSTTDLAPDFFAYTVIDRHGPRDPWGKTVGDLNGDGLPDVIVGGHASGGLVWYENPSARRHVISADGHFRTDHEVADIDGDGRNDVVSLADEGVIWFRNPDWTPTRIDTLRLHDVEVADLDGDGKLDLVARNQAGFGGQGDKIYLYRQRDPQRWEPHVLSVPDGEGLVVTDIDRDGRPDIVTNGVWLENPGTVEGAWRVHTYTRSWTWPHVFIAPADINGDGRVDIALAPAEHAGERYRLSWFEAPPDPRTLWQEHVVENDVEAVRHFVGAGDLDNDGRVDLVTAQMHQGAAPHYVTVYLNTGRGQGWIKRAIAATGSHSMRLVDIDNDGDLDLVGANWSGSRQTVELWRNLSCPAGLDRWTRHLIDPERPWRAVFIAPADLDGDGRQDIVTGGWWYRNPGRNAGPWERRALGASANNMAAVADFNGDGRIDVLATGGRGSEPDARLFFAQSAGAGDLRVFGQVAEGEGDFLQGVAVGRFDPGGPLQIALSWHKAGAGVQVLTVPSDPAQQTWPIARISPHSQDEQLSAGDIDRDGDLDLLLGTVWLRNDGGGRWTPFELARTPGNPDRNRLADIDGDGRLDALVGFEAVSRPGDLVWYGRPADPTGIWTEHKIARVVGPMSVDVADMDGDGDLDVVVGEHNLDRPERSRLLVFENLDGRGGRWREHVAWTGDEHHDGAQIVDIDGDGDLDVISVGWGHKRVLLYENRGPRCRLRR